MMAIVVVVVVSAFFLLEWIAVLLFFFSSSDLSSFVCSLAGSTGCVYRAKFSFQISTLLKVGKM